MTETESKKYLYHKEHAPKVFNESEFEVAKESGYMTVQEFREFKGKIIEKEKPKKPRKKNIQK